MIDSYINIDKSHKSFDKAFIDLGLNKLVLKNITNSNQINLVVTSLAKYGETKKNLSDFESTNKSFPTLIIVDDKDFEQTLSILSKKEIGPLNWIEFRDLKNGGDAFKQIHDGTCVAPKIILLP